MTTLVIGVGNEFRGDDGVGRHVARELQRRNPEGATIRESGGESFSLIEMWANAKKVILVDAIQSRTEPGTLQRFDVSQEAVPVEILSHCSTHGSSVPEAVELARSLDRLPPQMVLYGIEALHFDHGNALSSFARRAVDEVVDQILAELAEDGRGGNGSLNPTRPISN